MKRILALILCAAMMFTFAACGTKAPAETPEQTEAPEPVQTSQPVETEAPEAPEETTPSIGIATPDAPPIADGEAGPGFEIHEPDADLPDSDSGETVGSALLADFKARLEADPDISASDLAAALVGNEVIKFAGDSGEVEPGLLAGFDNNEITGFESGAHFGPMMSSIAFTGYVFVLGEDADVDAFKDLLESSANMRWQICVEADEMVVDNVGNYVLFVMAQNSED